MSRPRKREERKPLLAAVSDQSSRTQKSAAAAGSIIRLTAIKVPSA
jgi:hypothetical protein